MALALSIMHAALCRGIYDHKQNPVVTGYARPPHEYQVAEFQVVWRGNDLQGIHLDEIFSATTALFDATQSVALGKFKVTMGNANGNSIGIIVNAEYQFPLSWWIKGSKENKEFVHAIAFNDLARCLDLFATTRDSGQLLGFRPDPSPWWSELKRNFVQMRTKIRLQSAAAKEKLRQGARQKNFDK